jgi:hypothetical protein
MVVTWKNPLDFTAARIVAYAILPSPPSRCPSLVANTVNHACSSLVIRALGGAFCGKTHEPEVGSSPDLQSSLEILVNSFSSSWIRSAYLVAASTSC